MSAVHACSSLSSNACNSAALISSRAVATIAAVPAHPALTHRVCPPCWRPPDGTARGIAKLAPALCIIGNCANCPAHCLQMGARSPGRNSCHHTPCSITQVPIEYIPAPPFGTCSYTGDLVECFLLKARSWQSGAIAELWAAQCQSHRALAPLQPPTSTSSCGILCSVAESDLSLSTWLTL